MKNYLIVINDTVVRGNYDCEEKLKKSMLDIEVDRWNKTQDSAIISARIYEFTKVTQYDHNIKEVIRKKLIGRCKCIASLVDCNTIELFTQDKEYDINADGSIESNESFGVMFDEQTFNLYFTKK